MIEKCLPSKTKVFTQLTFFFKWLLSRTHLVPEHIYPPCLNIVTYFISIRLDSLRTLVTSSFKHVMDFIRLANQIKPCTVSVENARTNGGRCIGQLPRTKTGLSERSPSIGSLVMQYMPNRSCLVGSSVLLKRNNHDRCIPCGLRSSVVPHG